MKWKTCPLEGWHQGFAWTPIPLMDGTTIWMEPYRYYVSSHGLVTTIIGMPK
jgi:hypothetical protein